MKKMKKQTIIKISLHILFWIPTFYYFINNSVLRYQSMEIKEEYFALSFIILIIYINEFLIIPRYFNHKRFLNYFIILAFLLIIITTLEFLLLKDDILYYTSNTGSEFQNGVLRWNYFGIFFRDSLFVGFFTMFKIYRDAIKTNKLLHEVTDLEKQKMRTEINMVKSKVNSHFFFNTLNSIYAMALTESKETPDMITNLSELMRYVVADSENEWVTLDKEIEFINNYIALESIRHQKLDVQFDIEGDTENMNVPPMLFESFVNNAFKYTDNEGRGYIHIKLECLANRKLIFSCENNTRSTTDKSIQSSGKGLRNTRDRLQIHYNSKHQLDAKLEGEIYKVRLDLNNNIPLISK